MSRKGKYELHNYTVELNASKFLSLLMFHGENLRFADAANNKCELR